MAYDPVPRPDDAEAREHDPDYDAARLQAMQTYERRPVLDWPGYEADTEGCIWSLRPKWRTAGGHRLKSYLNTHGYPSVMVYRDVKRVFKTVHSMVILAFHGRPTAERRETRHLDGNPLNSRPENLVWGTRTENAGDRRRHGTLLFGSRMPMAKLTEETVGQMLRDAMAGATPTVLARAYGVSLSIACSIAMGQRWTHVQRPDGYVYVRRWDRRRA